MSLFTRAISAPSLALGKGIMLLGILLAFAGIGTQAARAEGIDKTQIEQIVRDYLLKNPEVITEALTELDRRQKAEADAERLAAVQDTASILFDSTRQVVLGNPEGSITLVEFFDYNCGYCKRAYGDMARLLKEEPELRMVLKEFPVLGQGSVEAARVAVAVNTIAPEKYPDFHQALLLQRGKANQASAMQAAIGTGISEDDLNKALATDESTQTIEEVYSLANRLGLTGTPSYVLGQEVLMGAVGYDELRSKVTAMKTCGETKC